MMPTLVDGDYIIVKNKPRQVLTGLIYVIDHSDLGRIVKRLTGQSADRFKFQGDNPDKSIPGSIIAPVERARITGQVLWAIGQKGIRRVR